MKTSLVILTLSTLIICFSLTGCKKDPTKNAKLPPITQEGKNTIGFTIDGEVWVPYYKCSLMGDPCGEIHASYGETGGRRQKELDSVLPEKEVTRCLI